MKSCGWANLRKMRRPCILALMKPLTVGRCSLILDDVRSNSTINFITVLLQGENALLILVWGHHDAADAARRGVYLIIYLHKLGCVALKEVILDLKHLIYIEVRCAEQNSKTSSPQIGLLVHGSTHLWDDERVSWIPHPMQLQFCYIAGLNLSILSWRQNFSCWFTIQIFSA